MGIIPSSGAGAPLKAERLFPNIGSLDESHLSCPWIPAGLCPKNLPWIRDTPQYLRFLNWEIHPWPRWRDLYSWQILSELLISNWIDNNVILPTYILWINYYKLCVGNSIRHKPLPKSETKTWPNCTLALIRSLDSNGGATLEFVAQCEGLLCPFVSHISL